MDKMVKHLSEKGMDNILDLIFRLAAGELDARGIPSDEGNDLDAILTGLNMLAEELSAITEERKRAEDALIVSENKYRTLVHDARDGICLTDADGNIVETNRQLAQIIGHEFEEFSGKKFTDFIAKEQYKLADKALKDAQGGSVSLFEGTLVCKNGNDVPVEVKSSFVEYEEHKKGVISIIRDITERKKNEERLRLAKNEAEEATKLKDKFISLVAHDLRSPLSTMIGFLELLNDGKNAGLDDFSRDIVARAIKSGNSMIKLIEEILNVSRIKSGKISPKLRFLDASIIALKVSHDLELLAGKKGIILKHEIPTRTRIYADEALFQEVIQNLISNAIKFCAKGDTIRIFVPEGDPCAIAVSDTGPGIQPERINHLFSYDRKTSTEGTAGETGTGLGLPLSYDIMLAHGGVLEIDSKPGKGSVFTAKLPEVKPVVLIVDDEEFIRTLLRGRILSLNTVVLEANDGEEAMEKIAKHKPNLVITDLQMPKTDGLKVLEFIKSNPDTAHTPVIILTSNSDMETRDRVVRLGADDFATKPIVINDFIPRIRRYLI
ncbi:MAG: response regulator [Nitrospinota bacterium]|nr:response regulator [Nitrospinota bacterium]